MKRVGLLLFTALILTACNDTINLKLTKLSVEQQDGNQAVATSIPRFSWNYETDAEEVFQTSYRIIVATTKEKAENNQGDLWDSGVINSQQMLYIPYAGKGVIIGVRTM